jgi:hypothetical protein
MKIAIEKLNEVIAQGSKLLLCSTSFEDRWAKVALTLDPGKVKSLIVLHKNDNDCETDIANIEKKHSLQANTVEISDVEPFSLWKIFATEIVPLIQDEPEEVIFDVTTVSHETLLIILAQLQENNLLNKIIFTYAGAKSYGKNMSSGVSDIRSVLGYSGGFTPSKSMHHLIILVGFELDRAKELIIEYEPSSISLGIGTEPYEESFFSENISYKEQLREFIATLGNSYKCVSEFTFSCSDVNEAKSAIIKEVEKFCLDSNVTVSPMNTKIATIAAGLAALEREDIKICYVEPLTYNKLDYSKAGEYVTVFRVGA